MEGVGTFILIAFGCLIGVGVQAWRQRRTGDEAREAAPQPDLRQVADEALAQLNCTPEWKAEGDKQHARFDYQSGHFQLTLAQDSPFVRLVYPYFFDAPIDRIETVRSLANHCNQNAECERIVYTLDEERHRVELHILSSVQLYPPIATDVLRKALRDSFAWQAAFAQAFHEMAEVGRHAPKGDMEREHADWANEMFLLREQELTHQGAGPDWRQTPGQPTTLGQLLAVLLSLRDLDYRSLSLMREGEAPQPIAPEEAAQYDLLRALQPEGQEPCPSSLLQVRYVSPARPDEERRLCVMLKDEGRTRDTQYYRATVTVEPLPVEAHRPEGTAENRVLSGTVLVALDLSSPEQRLAEFRYMRKEALAKSRQGRDGELTDEQRLLCATMDDSSAYHLYWGRMLYRQQRYVEALRHLEEGYRALAATYDAKEGEDNHAFFETCYLIGCCLSALGQYEKAYFYLEMVMPLHRLSYTEAYVNCLVNAGDLRAIGVIDGMLDEIQKGDGDDDDEQPAPHMLDFVAFLRRRKAYALVSRQRYDEAEQLLKPMLDEPGSCDYAIGELAYIQRKKKEHSDYVLHSKDI